MMEHFRQDLNFMKDLKKYINKHAYSKHVHNALLIFFSAYWFVLFFYLFFSFFFFGFVFLRTSFPNDMSEQVKNGQVRSLIILTRAFPVLTLSGRLSSPELKFCFSLFCFFYELQTRNSI